VIPEGVTEISNAMFYNCTALASVTIPLSVTSIQAWAFNACTSLTSARVPYGAEVSGDTAFLASTAIERFGPTFGDFGYTFTSAGSEVAIWVYSGTAETVVIPEAIGGKPVTKIAQDLFANHSEITSVTIPSGVTTLPQNVFQGCTSLTALEVGASHPVFSSVGGVLFNKEGTTLVRYPIGKSGSYQVPSTVTSIGARAFLKCGGLTAVTLPGGLIEVGESAFEECAGLTNLSLPVGLTSIVQNAFSRCTGLLSVSIPGTVTFIGGGAFAHCSGLTTVVISDGVTRIPDAMFVNCTALTSVTIPASVTLISDVAFSGCNSNDRSPPRSDDRSAFASA
jgi:hypothetical protein